MFTPGLMASKTARVEMNGEGLWLTAPTWRKVPTWTDATVQGLGMVFLSRSRCSPISQLGMLSEIVQIPP
ncbi:expressed unknown protein [Seminavis robusta]|uniref:Uncharacterized protein n=1 Tax=Seminavis robusta TaxID=568900 RepID=A0A9N8F062_9STRA|nr:expressed unknown protein [Seminavis robusta]|eukprot:Sro2539_g330600.1 n/a (70) ;mRNA; r:11469-11750